MNTQYAAFATPAAVALSVNRVRLLRARKPPSTVTPARRRVSVRMADEPEGSESQGSDSEENLVSAQDILKSMRDMSTEEVKRDDGTRSGRNMLGVYRDVDGRSNIWAVEPTEETDTKPQISKATIIAVAAAFIAAALLILPILPFTNPDQL